MQGTRRISLTLCVCVCVCVCVCARVRACVRGVCCVTENTKDFNTRISEYNKKYCTIFCFFIIIIIIIIIILYFIFLL